MLFDVIIVVFAGKFYTNIPLKLNDGKVSFVVYAFMVCSVHFSYLDKKVYMSFLSHSRSDLTFTQLEKK